MSKPPGPGVAGRDYIAAGSGVPDGHHFGSTANGAKAWLDAIAPTARADAGPRHASFLNDSKRVELSRVQHVAELVGKAVHDAGLDCSPEAIKQAVLDLVASDCERRGRGNTVGVRACDMRLPGEPPLKSRP